MPSATMPPLTKTAIEAWLVFTMAAVLFGAPMPCQAQQETLYLIAATPAQPESPQTYPATVYKVEQDRHLTSVLSAFSPTDHLTDIVDDLHGHIVLAGAAGIYIIPKDRPDGAEHISLKSFDDYPCWGAIFNPSQGPAVQYCVGSDIFQVLLDPQGAKAGAKKGSWAEFANLNYGGQIGGPFQTQSPIAELLGNRIVMPSAQDPKVTIAILPPSLAQKAAEQQLVRIVAANSTYLVLWVVPKHMFGHTIYTTDPDHAGPIEVQVLYRISNEWKLVQLPTTVSTLTQPAVRLFGDWLVTTEMTWKGGSHHDLTPASRSEGERMTQPGSRLPNLSQQYAYSFYGISIPGRLKFQNLADGRTETLTTGKEDTEVLAIEHGSEVYYRVDDAIYSVRIEGNELHDQQLLVKEPVITDVHWAIPPVTATPTAARTRP